MSFGIGSYAKKPAKDASWHIYVPTHEKLVYPLFEKYACCDHNPLNPDLECIRELNHPGEHECLNDGVAVYWGKPDPFEVVGLMKPDKAPFFSGHVMPEEMCGTQHSTLGVYCNLPKGHGLGDPTPHEAIHLATGLAITAPWWGLNDHKKMYIHGYTPPFCHEKAPEGILRGLAGQDSNYICTRPQGHCGPHQPHFSSTLTCIPPWYAKTNFYKKVEQFKAPPFMLNEV